MKKVFLKTLFILLSCFSLIVIFIPTTVLAPELTTKTSTRTNKLESKYEASNDNPNYFQVAEEDKQN